MTDTAPSDWSKLERIRYLLDQWDSIYDPNTTAPFGTPGDGTGVALLPLMAHHPSVLELSRCLQLLYHAAPGDYRHLKAFRCGVEWRIRTDHIRKRRPSGKGFEIVEVRSRAKITPAWLNMNRVHNAEAFLEDKFRGEVFIPAELWDALHTPAVAA